ncbi:MAG: hypothetical protein QM490_02150 [Candidatus Gracilibacteria bacterium]
MMKKILTLLIAFFALTSCYGTTEESSTDKIPVNENPADVTDIVENDSDDEKDDDENKNSTGTIDINIVENNSDDKDDSENNQNDSNTETNTDEEVLENEVNDLLDEFIDSLDNYDK